MTHRVVFAPEALDDLRGLYDLIADASLPDRTLAYVEGLRQHCLGLADFPERGTRRDAIRPGLRTLGYRRRVTVAFRVHGCCEALNALTPKRFRSRAHDPGW